MRNSLFRKYFLVVFSVFSLMLVMSFLVSFLLGQVERGQFQNGGPVFFAKLVAQSGEDKRVFAARFNREGLGAFPLQIDLIDSQGRSLLEDGVSMPEWNSLPLPQGEYESIPISHQGEGPPYTLVRIFDKEFPFVLVRFAPRPPGPQGHDRGRGHPHPGLPPHLGFQIFLSIFIAVLLASAVSIFLLFRSFRQKAYTAETVLNEMQRGNLKARFPVTKVDEIGRLMTLFNTMADELERVVVKLQDNEKLRIQLLQDLAHDLRTPVASQINLLETLRDNPSEISEKLKKEMLEMVCQETLYFGKLVEDLLLLASVSEPKYTPKSSQLNLGSLVQDVKKTLEYSHPGKVIEVKLPSDTNLNFVGDGHLMSRVIRNAFDNALSFCKSKVMVSFSQVGSELEMIIEDDGPGFSPQVLSEFGVKKQTRILSEERSGRASVGLGSVIICNIVRAHKGRVEIQNRVGEQGTVTGALLKVILPY